MSRDDILGGALIALIVGVIGAGGALKYSLSESSPIDPETLCPVDHVVPHTVILVDRTDRLTEDHVILFERAVEAEASALPIAGRLSIFTIEGEVRSVPEPVFSVCKPAEGKDAHWFHENKRRMQAQHEMRFASPLAAVLERLGKPAEADVSPILETIQSVARLPEFSPAAGVRRLVIVSDLLQNTPEYSQYRTLPDYDIFRDTPYASTVMAALTGVEVEIVYLPNRAAALRQTPEHLDFWIRYFTDRGAIVRGENVL